jgi:GNAT superfamily N-acetyltransferase
MPIAIVLIASWSPSALRTRDIVECEAIGLMEQTEDGLSDHIMLMQVVGERAEVTAEVEATLADFVQNVFRHVPGKRIGVGAFLGAAEAQGAIQACADCVRPTFVDVRTERFDSLSEYAKIPIAFAVQRVFEIEDGPAGLVLTERVLDAPYVKDYDSYETPMQWVKRFDLSTWGLLGAYVGDQRVGGAIVALDTLGLHLLDGRTDLALLWDIRVRPEYRKHGVGSALFQAVNVPACKFYQRHGCHLTAVNRHAYLALANEIQLLWSKHF